MTSIRELLQEIGRERMHPGDYEEPVRSAVFDMLEKEFFLAGIATSMLGNQAVPAEQRRIVQRLHFEKGQWFAGHSEPIEISHFPEVMRYASQLQMLAERIQRSWQS
jgi:hypothetical protein